MDEDPSLEAVLRFWFGGNDNAVLVAKRQANLWWNKSTEHDAEIRERFGVLRERAVKGALRSLEGTSRGLLGLIILVDQMSRHMFRDEPEAFEYDDLARKWCLTGLERGADEELDLLERVFFYVPLEHSESRAEQKRSVELYAQLKGRIPATERELFSIFLLFELSARKHCAVVDRFGRFPHRNRALGRPSSPEEIEFLKQPGSSF
jgi:uncharacterized protein (DUF924 family)